MDYWGCSAISVSLDRPDPFAPASGMVTIEAVVVAEEPVDRVAFYLDSVVIGDLENLATCRPDGASKSPPEPSVANAGRVDLR